MNFRTNPRFPGFTFNLRTKLILPYLLLALTVAMVAAHLVTQVILSSWNERFHNQLITAADEAADMVVRREQEQLNLWRQIAFTEGVAEVARTGSTAELKRLVEPVFLINNVDRLEVLAPDGTSLFSMSQGSENVVPASYTNGRLVQRIQADPVNRYAGLETVGNDILFFTGGALTTADGETGGILLVGTSLSTLATMLQESVLAGITLYAPDGQLLVTNVGQADTDVLVLTPLDAQEVLANQGGQTRIRTINPAGDEYAQILIPFELGPGEDVGILGMSLRLTLLTSPLYPVRQAVLTVFTLAVMGTLVIGYALATSMMRPIEQLMEASRQVATGDLAVQISPISRDEIGQLTLSFNQMVTQLRQRRYIEDLFGRYVGDNIARRILAGEAELGGQQIYATVLFADIRDFTAFTEKADLSALIGELNEYYTFMQHAIDAHGGVINKFGGDSILALFGAPVPLADHACRAVAAAAQMMDELTTLNERRLVRGDAPFSIGIGINTGQMIVGNLGSEERREYTVLGDTVNAAKRLSDLNKEMPLYSIFASHTTIRESGDSHEWQMENLGETHVKGKETAITVYALMPEITQKQVYTNGSPLKSRIL